MVTNQVLEFCSIKCPPDHLSNGQFHPRDSLSVILRTNLSRPNFFSARDQNLWQDGWCRQIDSVAFIQSKDSPPKPPPAAALLHGTMEENCYMGPWRDTRRGKNKSGSFSVNKKTQRECTVTSFWLSTKIAFEIWTYVASTYLKLSVLLDFILVHNISTRPFFIFPLPSES